MIETLSVSREQAFKFFDLTKHLMPELTKVQFTTGGLVRMRPSKPRTDAIHWFEFCFRFLVPKVVDHYVKHHVGMTNSFARLAITQKLFYELDKSHPVDLLYDIWVNPKDYRVD